jgi:hypothetical protein
VLEVAGSLGPEQAVTQGTSPRRVAREFVETGLGTADETGGLDDGGGCECSTCNKSIGGFCRAAIAYVVTK